MRQFILGKNVAYPSKSTVTDLSKLAAGAVGFFANESGKLVVDDDGSKIKKEGMLVLGRATADGGPVVIPIYKNKFSFVKSVYAAATTFKVEAAIPAGDKIGDYSIIVAKKGVKFNERNKWTATVHVTDITTSADALATALAKQINNNTVSSGVKAVAGTAKVTIQATTSGVDYAIVPADLLTGVTVTSSAIGFPAMNSAEYIADLAAKAAADAGIEYTYRDDVNYLYPNYPLDPLKGAQSADTGFIVYTLKFAEPREVRPVDEVINQIVQVAFPTGTTVTTFETVLAALAS